MVALTEPRMPALRIGAMGRGGVAPKKFVDDNAALERNLKPNGLTLREAEMAIVRNMFKQILVGNAEERITAITSLFMWFALGAFITSTITQYVIPALSNNATSAVVGIIVAVVAAVKCTA